MEDIGKILSSLSDDDINMLKGLAGSILGSADDGQGADEKPSEQPQQNFSMPQLGANELEMIMKVKKAFDSASTGKAGENAQLINALKPHLSEERRQRADQALELMRVFDMLPIIKELF